MATVTAGATGTVQFFADGGLFDTENVPVSGVVNSASINTLTAGSHTITAVYSGDTNYATSTGATVQTVNTAGPNTVSVTSSQNPSSFGQSVTLDGDHHWRKWTRQTPQCTSGAAGCNRDRHVEQQYGLRHNSGDSGQRWNGGMYGAELGRFRA